MTEPPIRLILDTSAVLAYAHGSDHVGEALQEVADESAVAAVPVVCLAEAYPLLADRERWRILAGHPHVIVLDAAAGESEELGSMCCLVEGVPAACAALAALDADCWVLTSRPDMYAGVAGGDLSIAFEEDR